MIELFWVAWGIATALGIGFHFYIEHGRKLSDRIGEEIFRSYQDEINVRIAAFEENLRQARMHTTLACTVLGVDPKATQEEIKNAYRRKAMKHHPDRGGDPETFQEIQAAYELLSKPVRCPECEGKGTIKVKRGAFVDKVQCPRCWPQGGT